MGALGPGKSGHGVKLITDLHLVPILTRVELYLRFLIRLYGTVLN